MDFAQAYPSSARLYGFSAAGILVLEDFEGFTFRDDVPPYVQHLAKRSRWLA
jgi:hypothetical protein